MKTRYINYKSVDSVNFEVTNYYEVAFPIQFPC